MSRTSIRLSRVPNENKYIVSVELYEVFFLTLLPRNGPSRMENKNTRKIRFEKKKGPCGCSFFHVLFFCVSRPRTGDNTWRIRERFIKQHPIVANRPSERHVRPRIFRKTQTLHVYCVCVYTNSITRRRRSNQFCRVQKKKKPNRPVGHDDGLRRPACVRATGVHQNRNAVDPKSLSDCTSDVVTVGPRRVAVLKWKKNCLRSVPDRIRKRFLIRFQIVPRVQNQRRIFDFFWE